MRSLILPLSVVFFSCSGVSDRRDRLADAYADVLRYRDSAAQADTGVVRHGIDSILAHYGMTRETYLDAFRGLSDDPATIQPFFQRVEARLAATSAAAVESPVRPAN